MSPKKIETVLSLIEICDTNLQNVKKILSLYLTEKGVKLDDVATTNAIKNSNRSSSDEKDALEVVEGFFDGENMVGDNGQIYPVPQNYASKTQLVVGDRMKWILTNYKEIFKLISPAPRQRATGNFTIEGDNYLVLVDEFPNPIKILKASATYAMKNLGLKIGDKIAIYIPKNGTPVWGAFISVVKGPVGIKKTNKAVTASLEELDSLSGLDLQSKNNEEKSAETSSSIDKKIEDFF